MAASRPRRPARRPLARARTLDGPRAGALTAARVELENAGSRAWRARRGRLCLVPLARRARQPDRLGRAPHAAAAPSRRASASSSSSRCARRSRPAATGSRSTSSRSTASGSPSSATTPLELDVEVLPRERRAAPGRTGCPRGDAEPAPATVARARRAPPHAEGYAAVGGSLDGRRAGGSAARPAELAARTRPAAAATRRFAHPLLCPSLLPGARAERRGRRAARLAPEGDEPWLYDGRIVIRLRLRSGRRRG